MRDEIAYKVLLPSEFAVLKRYGCFQGAPNDVASGFIHLSTAAQLDGTLEKHFGNLNDICIVAISLISLGERVKWEPAKNGQLYPHLFGTLPLDAVLAHGPLKRDKTGTVCLPTYELGHAKKMLAVPHCP